jgi:hypothetical protein
MLLEICCHVAIYLEKPKIENSRSFVVLLMRFTKKLLKVGEEHIFLSFLLCIAHSIAFQKILFLLFIHKKLRKCVPLPLPGVSL